MEVSVLPVTKDDILLLQDIGKKTFFETFSENNSEKSMKEYLEASFSIEKLSHELMDFNSEFYFATLRDEVIGYLKLNVGNSQTEIKNENALEIERIYVLKDFHGKKVGQILYEKAIQIAKQKKVNYIWLGVWENNERAINFYQKNGFVAFDKHIFKLGNEEQTDIMMKLVL